MTLNTLLNGSKLPLIVNAAALVPIAWALINIYSDVQGLKADRLERGPVERLAKLEAIVQTGLDNCYRAGDATRDLALRDLEIEHLKEDIITLKAKQ